jgi:HEAT repeat protein
MSDRLELMESCLELAEKGDRAALPVLLERLRHADWRVRYAAAVALGDLHDPAAVPGLIEALQLEDTAPLYTQKEEYGSMHAGANGELHLNLPAHLSEDTFEAWRRRGRIKQAVCLALGEMKALADAARPWLERYAVDQGEDPNVRAAACKALGLIGNPQSLPILKQATQDQEWCTEKEATKAVAALSHSLAP